jgi:hypothetical protein
VQYNDVLKTLQEEHKLLQDMEAALLEIKNTPSTSGRTSLVCIKPRTFTSTSTRRCAQACVLFAGACQAASQHTDGCQCLPTSQHGPAC